MADGESFLKNKTQLFISVVIISAIAIILVLMLPSSNNSKVENISLEIDNSPVLGSENAPVTIYEFSDFSCPYCGAAEGKNFDVINSLKSRASGWEAPLPAIKSDYVDSGKVKIVFKYYPGHGSATAAHAVALGLQEQKPELFWRFADEAFAIQATANLDDLGKMKAIAVGLGANITELEAYLDSREFEAQLNEDIAMAKANNIGGTPTFFINGIKIEGAQSYGTFQDIIDNELAK